MAHPTTQHGTAKRNGRAEHHTPARLEVLGVIPCISVRLSRCGGRLPRWSARTAVPPVIASCASRANALAELLRKLDDGYGLMCQET
jgi:hypothetical protein